MVCYHQKRRVLLRRSRTLWRRLQFRIPLTLDPIDPCSELLIALKLKELELQLKREECEAQRIRLRMVEAEKERDIQVRKLDFEAAQTHSVASFQTTFCCSTENTSGEFCS